MCTHREKKMLHKVVVEGSVTSLHELLQKDPIITEREREWSKCFTKQQHKEV